MIHTVSIESMIRIMAFCQNGANNATNTDKFKNLDRKDKTIDLDLSCSFQFMDLLSENNLSIKIKLNLKFRPGVLLSIAKIE